MNCEKKVEADDACESLHQKVMAKPLHCTYFLISLDCMR